MEEINLCNKEEYIILKDDFNDESTNNTLINDQEILEDLNLIKISSTHSIVSQIKKLSDKSYFVRCVVFIILCNPFIKLMINIFYNNNNNNDEKNKEINDNKNNNSSLEFEQIFKNQNLNFNNLLTERERKFISLLVIIMLMSFNLLIFVFIKEYHLQAIIFFFNNIYLLYFTFKNYLDTNESRLNKIDQN